MILLGLMLNAWDWFIGKPVTVDTPPDPETVPDPDFLVTYEGPDEMGFLQVYVNGELVAWEQRAAWASQPDLLPA